MFKTEGAGWRLARDLSKGVFCVLIAGDNWALELTHDEWENIYSLVQKLKEQFLELKKQLIEEECFSIDLEQNSIWGSISGNKEAWNLKVVLTGDGHSIRGVEMFWPVKSAQEVTKAMRSMWDSYE